jgi:hypothetical protein
MTSRLMAHLLLQFDDEAISSPHPCEGPNAHGRVLTPV